MGNICSRNSSIVDLWARLLSSSPLGGIIDMKTWSGSARELEFVRVREIESIRGRVSGPPDCLRVRGTGAADRWCPFVEFERERSRSFMADRSGLLVLAELECLRVFGCGV